MTEELSLPEPFARALDSIRGVSLRDDVRVAEIPSPPNVAPYAVSLTGDVLPAVHGRDSEEGTGRFILMFDPSEPEPWGGAFRVVSYAQAPLDTDMGTDPFLADVTWSWLIDALQAHDAAYHSASGTSTKIISQGFGELALQGMGTKIELRASWSPEGIDLSAHVLAWADLLAMIAGIPPRVDGLTPFRARSRRT